MGKRQKRFQSQEIVEASTLLKGKMSNIILKDNTVLAGRINIIADKKIQLQDSLYHKLTIDLEQVLEIIIDFEAPF